MSKKSSKKRPSKAKKAPEAAVEAAPETALSEGESIEPVESEEGTETLTPESSLAETLPEEVSAAEEETVVPEPAVAEDDSVSEDEPSNEEASSESGDAVPEESAVEETESAPSDDTSGEEGAIDVDELMGQEESAAPELPPQFPLKRVIESILFASQKPVSVKELQSVLKGSFEADKENPHTAPFAKLKEPALREAMGELVADYDASGRSFEVKESAAGWQLVTRPEFYPWLRQLYPENRSARLSAPAMETLAIIAYRQPITRADIEAIRGVAVDGVMQTLLDRSLVKIAGRAEIPGRPLLYETTQFFMEHFGLANLGDLPNAQELRKIALPTAATAEETKPAGKKAEAEVAPAEAVSEAPIAAEASPQDGEQNSPEPAESDSEAGEGEKAENAAVEEPSVAQSVEEFSEGTELVDEELAAAAPDEDVRPDAEDEPADETLQDEERHEH